MSINIFPSNVYVISTLSIPSTLGKVITVRNHFPTTKCLRNARTVPCGDTAVYANIQTLYGLNFLSLLKYQTAHEFGVIRRSCWNTDPTQNHEKYKIKTSQHTNRSLAYNLLLIIWQWSLLTYVQSLIVYYDLLLCEYFALFIMLFTHVDTVTRIILSFDNDKQNHFLYYTNIQH